MLQKVLARLFATSPARPALRAAITGAAFAVMIMVATLDISTRNSMEWSIVYAICVAFIAWYGTLWLGLLASFLAGALSLSSAALAGGASAPGEAVAAVPIAVILALFAVALNVLHQALVTATELARTDPLTGTNNSRALFEAASAELIRARRYGHQFTVVYFDLDDFKGVNDRFGHSAGDEVLRAFVKAISADTRRTDTLGRVGGDEFVLLMPETGRAAASGLLEKLRRNVRAKLCGGDCDVGISAGAVVFEKPPPCMDDMIRMADDTMYEAKRSGKDRTMLRVYPTDQAPTTLPAG